MGCLGRLWTETLLSVPMPSAAPLTVGLSLGAIVAAQIGPVWLLCARTTLRQGFRRGAAIGAGAAAADLVYAALGVAGAAALLRLTGLRVALSLVGATVVLVAGARTLRSAARIRLGGELDIEVADVPSSWRTGLLVTLSNPMTIVSWAAVFSASGVAGTVRGGAAIALLAGVGIGSLTWFLALSSTLALVRRHRGGQLSPTTLAAIDAVAGFGLVGFGAALGLRAVRD